MTGTSTDLAPSERTKRARAKRPPGDRICRIVRHLESCTVEEYAVRKQLELQLQYSMVPAMAPVHMRAPMGGSSKPVVPRDRGRAPHNHLPARQRSRSDGTPEEKTNLSMHVGRYMDSAQRMIPRVPFMRLLRELVHSQTTYRSPVRMQIGAVDALHSAAEFFLVGLYENANLCTAHTGRVTLMPRDLRLAIGIGGRRRKICS